MPPVCERWRIPPILGELLVCGAWARSRSTCCISVILGAAVIDDVMGLFVLAFLAASTTSSQGEGFGVAAMASSWFKPSVPAASGHQLLVATGA